MLNVYKKETLVSINQEDWIQVGYSPYVLIEETEEKDEIVLCNDSFKYCCNFLKNQCIRGLYIKYTHFRRKPLVVLSDGWGKKYKSYKNFNDITCKYVYTPAPTITLEYIVKHFSANKVIQYIKERGGVFNTSFIEEECPHV